MFSTNSGQAKTITGSNSEQSTLRSAVLAVLACLALVGVVRAENISDLNLNRVSSGGAGAESALDSQQRKAVESTIRNSTNKIWFETNVGQFPKDVRFGFRTTFGKTFVYDDHLQLISFQRDAKNEIKGQQVVDVRFTGSNPTWMIVPGGVSQVSGTYQQADGTALHPKIFNEITLQNVYEGIDLRLYSAEKGTLEFDWIVAKAQDYEQIRIAMNGQDGLLFDEEGSLTIQLHNQNMGMRIPESFQVIGGEKKPVSARMVVGDNTSEIRYEIAGELAKDQPLVIDPNVAWATYFDLNDTSAANAFDSYLYAIAVNANGVYCTGWVKESITNATFGPASAGNYMEVNAGFSQGTATNQNYVYRLSTDGLHITAWTSTQITGSTGNIPPTDLELFPDGRVLVSFNDSTLQIYAADLSTRAYNNKPFAISTINSIAIVDNSVFYVGGLMTAANTTLVPAASGLDATFGTAASEGVIIRYTLNASSVPVNNWATYVGGDGVENFTAIALTPNKTKLAFAVHSVVSTNYPALVNAVDSTAAGATELLVGVINEQVAKPANFDVFSFLGGASDEGQTGATNTGSCVVTTSNTGFWVGGNTASASFPGTTAALGGVANGAQTTNGGGTSDCFISFIPLNGSAGSGFQSTYIGGAANEIVGGITYDPIRDRLLLFGTTSGAFPTLDTTPTSIYYDSTPGGGLDIFIATFTGNLQTKDYATFIGDTGNDYLGDTGLLRGTGHVTYSAATDQVYLATTVHSTLPTTVVGGSIPGKDTGKSNTTNDVHVIFAFNISIFDYGDAPVSYEVGSPAAEAISPFIRMGATVDAEVGPNSSADAKGDDNKNTGSANDEDGVASLALLRVTDTTYSVTVSVLNTQNPATLMGWIDFNRNGTFDPGEKVSLAIPVAAAAVNRTLTWSGISGMVAGQSYLRLRLTDNAAITLPTGSDLLGHGEVEDHALFLQAADLQITKNDGVATAIPGTTTTYTIVVTNAGPGDVTGATVADTFPAAITNASWTAVATGGATGFVASGTGNISHTVNMPNGSTITYTVVATISPSATGTLTNTATVTAPATSPDLTPGNNTATDIDTLVPTADLSITKNDGVATAIPGNTVTYSIVVSNAGPSAVTGATITDTFPAAITSATWTATQTGGASGFTASSSGNISQTVNMPVGSTITYTVTATISPSATGSLANTATVAVPAGVTDPTPANNNATDTDILNPTADLRITKTDGVATAIPGNSVTYTIVVTNTGPSAVTGATVTDTFPAAITSATWTAAATGGATGFTASSSGNINQTVNMPVGSTITYTVTAVISPAATVSLSNTATVAAPGGVTDPTPANNSATDTDTLNPTADLQITKTDGSATAIPGNSITYTIVVTNAGPSLVTGATVADTIPATILTPTYTATTTGGATGFTASGSGNINNTVTMPVGSTITYLVTGTVSAAATGTLVNTATVTAPGTVTDPTPANNTATDTDTLVPTADLQITKTDGVATEIPGTSITYTIVVTNAGPSNVTGATVADTIPATILTPTYTATQTGGASGFTASGSGNISNTVTMPVGSTITYLVTGTISASATGSLTNTATVTAPAGVTDPTPANNTATDIDTLVPNADLSITKTDGAATEIPGTSITYTIVVSNAGPSVATGATVVDNLPATITGVTYTAVQAGGATGFTASGSGNLNDTVTMPVGSTITYTVTGTISASATGTLTNTATVTEPSGIIDPTPANNSATDIDTLNPTADLSITKTDGVATAIPGNSVTYTIVVTNSGPSAVTGATVTDTFPAAITSATWTAVQTGGASGFTASGSGNISNTVNMPVGSTITYTVTAAISPAATGTLVNTATVAVPGTVTDPTPANNTATDTDTLNPTADLSITKTDGSANAIPGNSITYTIVVSNAGPSLVTGATVADTIPATILTPTYTAVQTGGATGFTASGSGNINNTVTMPVGSTITYTVTGTVSAAATGTLTNTATVTAPAGVTDPTPANNTATDTDTLVPTADLQITKTDGVLAEVPGTSITYTIVVTNAGPSNVTGATVTDNLPATITGVTYTAVQTGGASGFTASGSGNISNTVTMPVGSTITYTVTGTISALATGSLTNTATVTAPAGVTDPNLANNTATDIDALGAQADLSITKTDGSATAIPGTSITYTIVVTNLGPSAVTAATVVDTLPATITGVTFTAVQSGGASGFTASGSGNLNETVNMPVSSTITYTVTGTVSASATGTLTNTATVTAPATVTDPTPGNNTATDTDTLVPTADLSITKTDGAATAIPGTSITYTIVVTNAGPSLVTGAVVADTIPAAILTPTYTAVQTGGATGFTASGSGNINNTVTMPVGSTITYTVTGTISASATGTLTNTATVTAPAGVTDPTPGNNTATDTDTLVPTADLSITKTDGVLTEIPGTSITYTIVVTNAGPSAVTGATVADTIPATILTPTYTAVQTGGASGFTASGSGNISHTVNMPVGSTITYTVTGTISASATGSLTNTATVTVPAGVTDPTPANNMATDTDTLVPTADLSITKTDGSATAIPGTNVTYTIVVTNAGPSAVTAATVADTLPATLSGVTYTASTTGGASGFTASGSGNINDTVNMPVGSTITYSVTGLLSAAATGTLVNTANVTAPATVTDPTPANNTATDTDTLVPTADLRITKTDGAVSAIPGTGITYTIVVTNVGPSNVTGATVADTIPATILTPTYTASATGGATGFTASGSGNINNTVNMPVGSTITYLVSGTISAAATGSLTNTATVTAPVGVTDPTPANNTATDIDALGPQADLQITKTDGVVNAVPGTTVTYTIVVTNAGPSTATGATIGDPLPAALINVTYTATATGGATGFTASGSGNITDTVTMPNGSTITYTVTATVSPSATGSLVNTATVTPPAGLTDPNLANNSATDTDTNTPQADLQITKTDGALTSVPGTGITYTIVVRNTGPSDVTGATVTDTPPATITGVTYTATQTGGATGFTASGSNSINNTVNMPTGSAITYILTGTISPSATGTLANTATVAVPAGVTDPTPGNNMATDTNTLVPTADLSITKTDGVATEIPGTSITYTIVVSNAGPSAVTGATVSDLLPATITGVTYTAVQTGGASGFTASGSGNINNTVNMPVSSTITYTVTGTISAAATGTLTNTATVTAPVGVTDPTPANNTATDVDTLVPTADLSITKTDGLTNAVPGTSITYTIVVTNAGPSNVTGATVADTMPANLTGVTYTAVQSGSATGFTASGSGNINDTVNMPSGSTITYSVTGTINASATGTLVNTATVTAPVGVTDPTPGNNSATDTDTLVPTADLSITKTDGVLAEVPGTGITYTIVVTNAGPSAVTGATVTDNLPAVITGVTYTATATGGATGFVASGSGNISNTVNMPVGSTITYLVSGTISAAATGTLTNTATVAVPAGVTDPTPANNTATDVDSLGPQADLQITKTDGSATAIPGTSITYTVVVTNVGPSAVTGATVVDTLPATITGVTYTAVQTGGASGFTSNGSGNINDTVNMPVGSTITYTLTGLVSAAATGTLTNTATVTAPAGVTDPTPGNNTATDTDTLVPTADLSITKTDGSLTAVPGTNNTYTIVVTNAGPSLVTGATVADILPATMSGVTYTAVTTGGATGFTASGSGNISDTVTMPVGSTITYTVIGLISSAATGTISNTATVTAPAGVTDPTPANNTATDTDNLTPRADLQITKTDGSATEIPGTNITYTIVVTNAGPSNVTGATVVDNLPATISGVTFTAVAAGGATGFTAVGSGNLNDTVNMPVGSSITYTVTGLISAAATGTLTNTATVTAPAGVTDPTPGNNTATDVDTLIPTADLQISKTDGSATATPGTNITYTIVVTNSGPSNVTGATVVDNLPATITGVTYTATSTGGATGFTASGSGNISDTVNMPNGSTITYTVTGTISMSATGTLSNTATVTPPGGTTDPTPGNNTSTDTDNLTPRADLSITKTDGSTTWVPGTNITYTIVVSNAGPSNVTAATVTDALPATISGVTFTATQTGGATGFTASGNGNLNETVNMPVGSTITYTVTGLVSSAATGSLVNTATVTAPATVNDPTPANNTATDTDTLTPQADLQITKTDSSATAIPGTSITYTIVVTNAGPSNVTGASVVDTLPATISSVTFTAIQSGGASGFTSNGNGNINDTVNMPVGSSITYTVTGTISAAATGTLANTATVTPPGGTTDPTPGNNTATDTDTLTPRADLSITKTDGSTTWVPGTNITYTIVVSNAGPSNVTGASVVDTLPGTISGATFTAVQTGGASGFTSNGSGSINDTVNMPVGSTITYTLTGLVSAAATGTLTNTATVAVPSGVTDPTPANNSATDTDTLTPQADLQIVKTDSSATAVPGTSITYTITVTNAGPSNVTGATVVDNLPATITSVTYTAVQTGGASGFTSNGSGNINDTVNMPTGSTITYTLTGTISAAATGTLSNTATVTPPGGTTDPTPGNNTSTDTDNLTPRADLQITKTDGSATEIPGTNVTYTIVVTNAGPSAVTGATVNDVLPATISGVTFTATQVGGASGFTASGSGNLNETVNMPVGSTITYTVTGLISAAATGTLTNTATVTAPAGVTDPTPANNTATDVDTLVPTADLQITKTDSSATAVPGTSVTYTIVVTNAGPSNVTGASVVDTLPAAISGVTFTATQTGGATGFTSVGSGNINDTVNMPVGSTITYTVTGTISPAATGTLSNTATVTPPGGTTDPTPGNNTSTDTDTLTPRADLSITNTDGVVTVIPGTNNTYTIVVTNSGPSNVTGALVQDLFPAIFTGATFTATSTGGATGFSSVGSGNINDTVNMPVGSTITYTVTGLVSPAATGTLTTTATVTAPAGVTDPTPGNNTATDTDTLTPTADLQIVKTNNAAAVVPGTNVTYTITVTNAGPSNVVGGTVVDTMPSALTGVTYTATQTGGASGFTASGSGNISDTVNMPTGSTITYTVTALVSPAATGTLANTATVTPPTGTNDPTPGNNTSTDNDPLTPRVDLQITNTDGVVTVIPGTNNTYTIVVTNAGPSNVTGATIQDIFPAFFTGATFTATSTGGATGFTASGSGNINDTVNMPTGSTITYTVTGLVSASATGSLVNTATVSAPAGVTDPTPANNTATDTDTIVPTADLQITKTNGTATSIPGTSVTYTIVVSNTGPSNVTGATVVDTMPAALTNVTYKAIATGGATGFTASGSGNINDTVNMPNGSTITYTVSATVSAAAAGTLSNTATVTPPTGTNDPKPGNNTSTDDDPLTPRADLSIAKTNGTATSVPGTNVTYTIVATNAGPSNVVGASIVDTMPAALSGVTFTAVATGGATGFTASGTGNISDIVNIPAGGTITYTVTGAISSAAAGTLSNTATVTPPTGTNDPTPGNNTSTDTDTLTPVTDLKIVKTASTATPPMLTVLTYTITVTNLGPSDAAAVTASDLLPAGLTFISAQPDQGTYSAATGVWNVGNLVRNASTKMTVNAQVQLGTANQPIVNKASITGGGGTDPDPNNNTSTVTVTPPPCTTPTLSSAVVANPTSTSPGALITFSAAVTDPENRTLTYAWNWGDGSTGSGASTTHAYAAPGQFTATLTVSNDCGNSVSSLATVTITNVDCDSQKPAIKNPPSMAADFIGAGMTFTFTANATDKEDGVLSGVDWDFGDGSNGNGAVVTHTYATTGLFFVKATVQDSDDNCRESIMVVSPFPGQSSTSTGVTGVPGLGKLTCSLLRIKVNFKNRTQDSMTLVTELSDAPVPTIVGKPFTIQVGNYVVSGTFNNHGAYKDPFQAVQTKKLGDKVIVTLKVNKKDLKKALGLPANADILKENSPAMGLKVNIGGTNFAGNFAVQYNSAKGNTGTLTK